METQLQPVSTKMHASFGLQYPSHEGASAWPHGVDRHSHAPPDATAEQCEPPPHVPVHVRLLSSNAHGAAGTVVVVAPGTVVVDEEVDTDVRVAGAQSSCAPLNATTRAPPSSSVRDAGAGNGRGQ